LSKVDKSCPEQIRNRDLFLCETQDLLEKSLGRSLDLKIGAFLRVEISGVCPKLLPIKENLISKGLCDRK